MGGLNNLFLIVLEAGNLKSRCHNMHFLVRAYFLVCSGCLCIVSSQGIEEKEEASSLRSPLMGAQISSCNMYPHEQSSPIGLSPNAILLRNEILTYGFGEGKTHNSNP
jgi:hypothetical protein